MKWCAILQSYSFQGSFHSRYASYLNSNNHGNSRLTRTGNVRANEDFQVPKSSCALMCDLALAKRLFARRRSLLIVGEPDFRKYESWNLRKKYFAGIICGEHFPQSTVRSGMIASLACGQLNRRTLFPLVRSRPRIWSREAGPAILSCLNPIILQTLMLTLVILPAFHDGVHIVYRQPPSRQSRVYRATQ